MHCPGLPLAIGPVAAGWQEPAARQAACAATVTSSAVRLLDRISSFEAACMARCIVRKSSIYSPQLTRLLRQLCGGRSLARPDLCLARLQPCSLLSEWYYSSGCVLDRPREPGHLPVRPLGIDLQRRRHRAHRLDLSDRFKVAGNRSNLLVKTPTLGDAGW